MRAAGELKGKSARGGGKKCERRREKESSEREKVRGGREVEVGGEWPGSSWKQAERN